MGKDTRGHRSIARRIFLSQRLTAKLEARLAKAVARLAQPERLTSEEQKDLHDLLHQLQSWIPVLKRPFRDAKLAHLHLNDPVDVQMHNVWRDEAKTIPVTYPAPRFVAIVQKHHEVTHNKTETIKRVAKEIGTSERTVRTLLDEWNIELFTDPDSPPSA